MNFSAKAKMVDLGFKKSTYRRSHPSRQKKYGGVSLDVKKKLILLGGVITVLSLVLGSFSLRLYDRLGRSDFFQITAIDIRGAQRMSKKLVMQLSGVDIHSNILTLDAEEIRSSIESHEWVKKAECIKDWPNRLIITIEERVPVAILAEREGLFYVDGDGQAFTRALPPEELDYPVITGLSELRDDATAKKAMDSALLFLRYTGLGDSILPRQNISEIHMDGSGLLVLYLVNRPFPIFIGNDGMGTAYHRLAKVLYWLYKKNEFSRTEYIRLQYGNDKVLVGFESPVGEKKKGKANS